MLEQMESKESQKQRENEYYEILNILEMRAKKTRLSILILVYTLIFVAVLVIMVTYQLSNNKSPISDFTSSLLSLSEKAKTEAAFNKFKEAITTFANTEKKPDTVPHSAHNPENLMFSVSAVSSLLSQNSPSEKIASSIATVLMSFSAILFIAFVMKAILVFIRYYMQLGTDYENQKMAFILSKGTQPEFQELLLSLRDHNISFEKTPSLPQEKIITGLIEAIGLAKNKVKSDG
ncbi:hypothetical protein V2E82_002447 [Klebsiella aerogenes]|nr:hypothetical protein [Klebsiella aerogenes]